MPNLPTHRTGNRGAIKLRTAMLVFGVVCIVAGAALLIGPIYNVWHRGQEDQSAINGWNSGGSDLLAKPGPSGSTNFAGCGSGSGADYALVQFQSPTQYHYAGVAGDGTWDLLNTRTMVHYHGTPNPGQFGNVIIAFHREPDYQYIDQLNKGQMVSIQDRSCHWYNYQVTGKWVLNPNQVTQLQPTQGHNLTLVTCTPFWQDTQRIVWRASLVS